MSFQYRKLNPDSESDIKAAVRLFKEAGWLRDPEDKGPKGVKVFMQAQSTNVVEINDEPECLVSMTKATLKYVETEIPLSIVGAVITSRVARRQHIATSLTANSLAEHIIETNAPIATLGMFEQGFYDRLGFGTGTQIHFLTIDPATLRTPTPTRPPIRLTLDDWQRIHDNRLAGIRGHGSVRVPHPNVTQAELIDGSNGFGLGFTDEKTGRLTHHFWCLPDDVGNGPYNIQWLAYENRSQLLELFSTIAGLGDQVNLISMEQPTGIQMQDLIEKPFTRRRISKKSKFETGCQTFAWCQSRICNLPAALEKTHLPGPDDITFNLELSDPISQHLSDELRNQWSGVGGTYRVTLGPDSNAEQVNKSDSTLPTLQTSVNTFTRLWLGVQPPTGLAVTCPDLNAPEPLLNQLDHIMSTLPTQPQPDWWF